MADHKQTQIEGAPIPDANTWSLMRSVYKEVKGNSDPCDKDLWKAVAANPNGLTVPYAVKQTRHKGRGLFCVEDIPKGTVVCNGLSGRFQTEDQWRRFLGLLPPELAKDSVDWALVDEDSDSEEEMVYIDFCDVVFLNHGGMKEGKANVKSKDFRDGGWGMVATRDIVAGEELLCDYSQCGLGYDHSLEWYHKIHQEYYPGVAVDASELDRFVE